MSDALPLPPHPNLEQYKKLAKDLQRASRSTDPGAIHHWALLWTEKLARLQGIEGGSEARSQIEAEAERIDRRWQEARKKQRRSTGCTLSAAQLFVAREHGFLSWPKFVAHLKALARSTSPVSKFEAAVDSIVSGDLEKLRSLLRQDPGLARARSTREHRSTLLHYASANGVEDFRQKTPKNIVAITRLLLETGADVNAESEAYGGGSTTLGLVATSIHPQQAGVQIPLLQLLLEHGARFDQPSAAGNAQSIVHGCLANGQPEAAEYLASRGAEVDLEAAAAMGRLDAVKSHFDQKGALKPPATREQVESGFLHACGYGHAPIVEFLLEKGVPTGLRNNDGQTGLHWAAYGADVTMVKLLLRHGAPVDVKDRGFQATPLDVGLWVWNKSPDADERERCYEVITLLARAGAKLDPEQWRNPRRSGEGMLEKIAADPRMLAALRGEIRA